jgi:hypothetical protein
VELQRVVLRYILVLSYVRRVRYYGYTIPVSAEAHFTIDDEKIVAIDVAIVDFGIVVGSDDDGRGQRCRPRLFVFDVFRVVGIVGPE